MEEKIVEMLEKMYFELQLTRNEFKTQIIKLELKIENELSKKVDMLFERQDEICEQLEAIEKNLEDLVNQSDRHDMRIKVMEHDKYKRQEVGLV